MTRRMTLLLAAGLGAALLAGSAAYAMQSDEAAQLRASGLVAERFDGYLALAGTAPADVRSRMEAINIQRRAAYTRLAADRGATIEEVAAATACQLFAGRIPPNGKYVMPDGVVRTRNGSEPVPRPAHCG